MNVGGALLRACNQFLIENLNRISFQLIHNINHKLIDIGLVLSFSHFPKRISRFESFCDVI